MPLFRHLIFFFITVLTLSSCNSDDRLTILKHCSVLGDESIIYARAHYVKLFYTFNPKKFETSYKQIGDFDPIAINNTIHTYSRAVVKYEETQQETMDKTTQDLISSCKALSDFSLKFVKNDYPKAIDHESDSSSLTDTFFIEINKIVKFDHKLGDFDKNDSSFKQIVGNYQKAVSHYIEKYRKSIPTEYLQKRSLR